MTTWTQLISPLSTPPLFSSRTFSDAGLPVFVIPGADFPPWAPIAFGLIGLATIAVLIYQAVRYFRDNRDE